MTARRKRREIRFFKKYALAPTSPSRGLNLNHQGVLKPARPSHCKSIYLFDGDANLEGDSELPDILSRLVDEQGFPKLARSSLARSISFPLERWQTSKYTLQSSTMGCLLSERAMSGFINIFKDVLSTVSDTLATADIQHAAAESGGCGPSQSTPLYNCLQSTCLNVDQASTSDKMNVDKVFHEKGMKMDQLLNASNMNPTAVIDGLYSAGKAALLQNVEGSLPIPLAKAHLEVKQATFWDQPPSAKVLICGRRREMEDTAVIRPSFVQVPLDTMNDGQMMDLHFYAVYDGHGGSQASKYCAEWLHHALAEEIVSCSMHGDNSNGGEWKSIMSSCFMKMDKEVGGVCPYGACDEVDSSAGCCVGSIAPENTGTTAVVAVVSSSQIILANCGDSRAVLSRGGKAIPLSQDHKPERADETSRIEAAGGQVIAWKGFRVGAILALSRAIGDRYLKRYVISEPDVICLQRTEEDQCLILASDGLWDVLDNETACEVARRCLTSSRGRHKCRVTAQGDDYASASAAATLVKLACGKGSQDNITVVVIDLSYRKK